MSRDIRSLKPRKVISALQKAGFIVHRVKGSHYIMKHPVTERRFPVPFHNKDMKKGTLRGIIKQAGLTREEFLELL